VFTKCGFLWDENHQDSWSLKAASIQTEVENSLDRLGIDAIDLYQIHWPGLPPDGDTSDIEEAWTTLAKLRTAGKVRNIGVSNFDTAQLARIQGIAHVESLQLPYSVVSRDVEKSILPYCQEHHIGVLAYSPMESGLLSGSMTRERIKQLPSDDWRREFNPAFVEPHLTRNLDVVEVMRAIGKRHGRSPGEVAIAWVLQNPTVTGAIVGMRRPSQVAGIIGAAEFRLSPGEIEQIES
jgi:aryl-alcohol dehydrogenase-like predicted oxidoreductase